MLSICPKCQETKLVEERGNYYCLNCDYQCRERIPLHAPSPYSYDKEYQMETVDQKYGYIFYFKEGETKMFGKEPHIHIRGQGREIQYFLSPFQLKKKMPRNFPRGEESKLERWAYGRRHEYLAKWEKSKNK